MLVRLLTPPGRGASRIRPFCRHVAVDVRGLLPAAQERHRQPLGVHRPDVDVCRIAADGVEAVACGAEGEYARAAGHTAHDEPNQLVIKPFKERHRDGHASPTVLMGEKRKERKHTRQTRDGTRTGSPPARAGFWKDDQGDRWGSPAPDKGHDRLAARCAVEAAYCGRNHAFFLSRASVRGERHCAWCGVHCRS